MLDFGDKIYRQILDFCDSRDLEAGFSGYPFFDYSRRVTAAGILPRLAKNFQSPDFSIACGRRHPGDDLRRNFVITSIAVARWVDKNKYFELFNSRFEWDFRREVGYLKKAGIVSETKNKLVWRLKDAGAGYKSYFPHVLKFWYHPKYIKRFIKESS